MIKNTYNNLYIGVTNKPQRRLSEHNSRRGASFTKYKNIFHIAFLEPHETLSSARKREIQIKKWRREKKEVLVERYLKKLPTKIKGA